MEHFVTLFNLNNLQYSLENICAVCVDFRLLMDVHINPIESLIIEHVSASLHLKTVEPKLLSVHGKLAVINEVDAT
jgi:hypothetical protein